MLFVVANPYVRIWWAPINVSVILDFILCQESVEVRCWSV